MKKDFEKERASAVQRFLDGEKAVGSALDTGQPTSAETGVRSQHLKNIFSSLGGIWWKR